MIEATQEHTNAQIVVTGTHSMLFTEKTPIFLKDYETIQRERNEAKKKKSDKKEQIAILDKETKAYRSYEVQQQKKGSKSELKTDQLQSVPTVNNKNKTSYFIRMDMNLADKIRQEYQKKLAEIERNKKIEEDKEDKKRKKDRTLMVRISDSTSSSQLSDFEKEEKVRKKKNLFNQRDNAQYLYQVHDLNAILDNMLENVKDDIISIGIIDKENIDEALKKISNFPVVGIYYSKEDEVWFAFCITKQNNRTRATILDLSESPNTISLFQTKLRKLYSNKIDFGYFGNYEVVPRTARDIMLIEGLKELITYLTKKNGKLDLDHDFNYISKEKVEQKRESLVNAYTKSVYGMPLKEMKILLKTWNELIQGLSQDLLKELLKAIKDEGLERFFQDNTGFSLKLESIEILVDDSNKTNIRDLFIISNDKYSTITDELIKIINQNLKTQSQEWLNKISQESRSSGSNQSQGMD